MPKSKTDPKRKQKLNSYKNKHKQMNQQLSNSMPPVRSIPTWTQDAKIEVAGFEWEAIQQSLATLQLATQAAQSVMSRNLVNGNIVMDFEKLNPQTLRYEPMTAEEKQPHVDEFNKTLEAFRASQKQASVAPTAKPEPSGLVSSTGEPLSSETPDDVKFEAELAAEEAKPKKKAKVVPITKFVNQEQPDQEPPKTQA